MGLQYVKTVTAKIRTALIFFFFFFLMDEGTPLAFHKDDTQTGQKAHENCARYL